MNNDNWRNHVATGYSALAFSLPERGERVERHLRSAELIGEISRIIKSGGKVRIVEDDDGNVTNYEALTHE